MAHHNRLCNVVADAKTRIGALGSLADLVKPLEDTLMVCLVNADPKILYGDLDLRTITMQPHQDAVRPGRIFDGVGEQIDDDLAQALLISIEPGATLPLQHDAILRSAISASSDSAFCCNSVIARILGQELPRATLDHGDKALLQLRCARAGLAIANHQVVDLDHRRDLF